MFKILEFLEFNSFLFDSSVILFHIGLLGLVLNRSNVLKTLMCLELMLLAINLSFIYFSLYLDDIEGYIFVLFILVLSATESSVGLAMLSIYYERRNVISFDPIKAWGYFSKH